jgi:hypothetical protein
MSLAFQTPLFGRNVMPAENDRAHPFVPRPQNRRACLAIATTWSGDRSKPVPVGIPEDSRQAYQQGYPSHQAMMRAIGTAVARLSPDVAVECVRDRAGVTVDLPAKAHSDTGCRRKASAGDREHDRAPIRTAVAKRAKDRGSCVMTGCCPHQL